MEMVEMTTDFETKLCTPSESTSFSEFEYYQMFMSYAILRSQDMCIDYGMGEIFIPNKKSGDVEEAYINNLLVYA